MEPFNFCGKVITFGARPAQTGAFIVDSSSDTLPLLQAGASTPDRSDPKKAKSAWYRLGKFLSMEKFPRNIIIFVTIVACCVPFDYFAFRAAKTNSLVDVRPDAYLQFMPRGKATTVAYTSMGEVFGYGKLFPYMWLIQPNNNQSVMSPEFFETANNIVADFVQNVPNVSADDINGLVYFQGFGGQQLYAAVEYCINRTQYPCSILNLLKAQFVNTPGNATWLAVALSFDPMRFALA